MILTLWNQICFATVREVDLWIPLGLEHPLVLLIVNCGNLVQVESSAVAV